MKIIMRARRKGTDNPYTRIDKVQLQDSDILFNTDVMEFEPDSSEQSNPEQFKSNDVIDWDYYRIHAAIAAMQGILSNTDTINQYYNEHKEHGTLVEVVVNASVTYADALIKELNKNISNYLKE